MSVCISFPPPSFSELYVQFEGWKPDLPTLASISALIGIPYPIYKGISQYSSEVSQIVQFFRAKLSTMNILEIVKSFASVVGSELKSLIPDLPVIGINILDLVTMDANALRDAVESAYRNSKEALLGFLSPFLSSPIFPDLDIPSFEVISILKAIYTYCSNLLLNLAVSLVRPVLKALNIKASFSMPTLPTFSELKSLVMSEASSLVESITGEVKEFSSELEALGSLAHNYGVSVESFLSGLSFPSFSLPSVISLKDFKSVSMQIVEGFSQYLSDMVAQGIQMVTKFAKDVLGVLKIPFPTICLP